MFEKFHRGDIYSADLSPGIGSEQSGSRPVLILQNNVEIVSVLRLLLQQLPV